MWSASIQSIHDTPVPSAKKVVNVRFTDGAREILRTYHMGADQVDTAQEVVSFLQAEVEKLDQLDQIAADLMDVLAQEITTTSAPMAGSWVFPYQARKALFNAGLLDAVEGLLAQPQHREAQLRWEYGLRVERNNPFIVSLGPALDLTPEQIDALFDAARGVK